MAIRVRVAGDESTVSVYRHLLELTEHNIKSCKGLPGTEIPQKHMKKLAPGSFMTSGEAEAGLDFNE